MSNTKILFITLIHFIVCVLGLLVIQEVLSNTNQLPMGISWIWLAFCALTIPNALKIKKDQLIWHKKHWLILTTVMMLIPFIKVPSSDVWHLSSALLFLLYQLSGPAVCEELFFRVRFDQLTRNWNGSTLLCVINGILFSSCHLIIRGPELLAFLTFFPGIFLWIIYRKDKNLWTVILLHWLFNASFYAVFYRYEVNLTYFLEKILV